MHAGLLLGTCRRVQSTLKRYTYADSMWSNGIVERRRPTSNAMKSPEKNNNKKNDGHSLCSHFFFVVFWLNEIQKIYLFVRLRKYQHKVQVDKRCSRTVCNASFWEQTEISIRTEFGQINNSLATTSIEFQSMNRFLFRKKRRNTPTE